MVIREYLQDDFSHTEKDSNIVIKGKFVNHKHKDWDWYASDSATFNDNSGHMSYASYLGRKTECLVEKQVYKTNQNKKDLQSYADYQSQSFKVKTQGWFTREGFLRSPKQLKEWRRVNPISKKTPIWDYVISFRQDYQEKNEIFSSKKAQKIVNSTFDDFIESNGLDPKAFVFTGAFHVDKPHHFHMHLQIHQIRESKFDYKRGKEIYLTRGKFKVKSIEKWKENIDKHLLKQKKIFKGFNHLRDNVVHKTLGGFDDYRTFKNILEDAQLIKKRLPKGRFQYNSIKNFQTKLLVKETTKKLINSDALNLKMFNEMNQFIEDKINEQLILLDEIKDKFTIKNLKDLCQEKKDELFDHLANQTLKKIKGLKTIGYLPPSHKKRAQAIKLQKNHNKKLMKNFKKKEEWWQKALKEMDERIAKELKRINKELKDIQHFKTEI